METALDVLSHAATIVQDNANETRLSSKELPTAKWRRDRRLRAGEYHANITSATAVSSTITSSPPGQSHHPNALLHHPHHHHLPQQQQQQPQHHHHQMNSLPAHMSMASAHPIRPLCEVTHDDYDSEIAMETPLDMRVSSASLKHRASPPPPYREPLPGSTFASSLARPSVITQAPPKRYSHDSNIQIPNREIDNCSTESISMCETVIDEHFRRSLGPNYVALFGKKSPAPTTTPSPQPRSMTSSPPPSLSGTSNNGQMIIVGQQPQQIPPPAYQLSPQTLISPKASSSPNTPLMLIKSAPSSPQVQSIVTLPPPQEQPLALQRTPPIASASSSPHLNNIMQPLSPQHLSNQLTITTTSQPSTANSTPQPSPSGTTPSSPRPNSNGTNNYTSSPSPNQHQQLIQQQYQQLPQHHQQQIQQIQPQQQQVQQQQQQQQQNSSSSSLTKVVRIKNEPGILPLNSNSNMTNHCSPPSSPMSSSNASGSISINNSADEVPSVDDHFAKALGDTWKKLLQENKK